MNRRNFFLALPALPMIGLLALETRPQTGKCVLKIETAELITGPEFEEEVEKAMVKAVKALQRKSKAFQQRLRGMP